MSCLVASRGDCGFPGVTIPYPYNAIGREGPGALHSERLGHGMEWLDGPTENGPSYRLSLKMDENGRKNTYRVFIFIFFYRTETEIGISETETNEHIRLIGNKLNRSGLYQKRSVTGNQVENIEPT
jgi:hypothetical protein